MRRRHSRRGRGGIEAERLWFSALCAAAAATAYRASLAVTGDEDRSAAALERGFRDAWRRRSRRPAGRLASDWAVALVVARSRRPRGVDDVPEPGRWVNVPPPLIDTISAIPGRSLRARGLTTVLAVLGMVMVVVALLGVTAGLTAVLK